jgi:CubicO group peptidase (beta-lactamase class C family)
MTRNQIPGVSVRFGPEFFAEAGWGLGWDVQGDRPAWRGGSLRSAAAFGHNGAGGTYLWVDPVHDLVGVYFSVVRAGTPGLFARWSADLFVNAVMAAVVGA